MTFDITYGKLKKRVLDLLCEYSSNSDTVFVANGDMELLQAKLPDAVNSALVQMYKSLPIGVARAEQRIWRGREIVCTKGIPEGNVSIPVCSTAVCFEYFGSGNVCFYNQNGELALSIACEGDDSLKTKREAVILPNEGIYRICAGEGLKVVSFALYEYTDGGKIGRFCTAGRVSAELPERFDRFLCVVGNKGKTDNGLIEISDGFAYFPKEIFSGLDSAVMHYEKSAERVGADTPDSFTFDLEALAFEALICLTASFICREQDAAIHTRLVYRYNDLCEGIRSTPQKRIRRNGFYVAGGKKGW